MTESGSTRRHLFLGLGLIALIILVQVIVERLMGRVWLCECGVVKLWEGEVHSSGNSQQIADWYTPSHIIHGFLFYGLGFLVLRRAPLSLRLGLAGLIEAGWELLENSPVIIERYRSATMAYDYMGDSILNSGMDTVWMTLGFLAAWKLPVKVTIALAIAAEIATGILIRDNLTLNVIMLIYPIEAIKVWQGGI
ncbi:DUF2585 domain-containing protein [Rhizobium sp. TRM95796]|uniref:DUF2585 domain-containing protein n=1 Tax=Rhizobium sp. TRM95796 TaxID=2979862 RepID=UPI0021E81ADD|nr:DUF2585 domain-containing protein [Rhizobium sp. TRM95796]MCV3767442.1 DUF2585 domain-containing protein [Rhizobium sp. TRM95796]